MYVHAHKNVFVLVHLYLLRALAIPMNFKNKSWKLAYVGMKPMEKLFNRKSKILACQERGHIMQIKGH